MSLEENKVLLRQYLDAWGRGDLTQLRQMLAANYVSYDPTTGASLGDDFEAEACRIWHDSFDDVQVHIKQILAEGDRVTVYWLLTSTHTREFMGIAATGKKVSVPGMEINHIVNGRIAGIWRLSDTMSLMQQLGAL